MARTRTRLATLLLCAIAALGSVGLAESVARLALGPPPSSVPRVLFFAPGSFASNACGGVQYAPNRSLRTVAIWGDRVAYDVRFQTNDLGFVDSIDYGGKGRPPSGRRIAFVGDSFTAGYQAGGPTWLARLRETTRATHPELTLYNLGVDGTGLVHFHRTLRCFAQQVRVDEIVVLFISDDLRRVAWLPRESPDLIQFCYPADCSLGRLDVPKLVGDAETPEQLVERARTLYARRARSGPGSAWSRIEDASRVASLLGEAGRRMRRGSGGGDDEGRTFFTAAERSAVVNLLKKFRADFGARKLTFLHLPQRPEVERGRYLEDVSFLFAEQGLAYVPLLERCEFTADGFFERDPHPNARGYSQILACVQSQLGL